MSIKELTSDKPKYFNVVDPLVFIGKNAKPEFLEEIITYKKGEKRQIIKYKGKEVRNEIIYKT